MTGQVKEPRFPLGRAAGRGRGWYRGDCHVHSVASHGGELTPGQLAAAARAAGLDFIAVTEHNTAGTHGEWGRLADDDLLVIPGQEVVTGTGHWLALGTRPGQVAEWGYGVRDGDAPYPGGVFMYPLDGFDAVEVWNGLWSSDRPWNADNGAATAEWGRALAVGIRGGRWLPAIGCSDAHLDGQLAIPHTAVLADELSASAILAGIRAGRSWIAESAAVSLSLAVRAGGRVAGIGERLETGGGPASVRVAADGVPSGTVSFHTDRGAVHRESLPAEGPGTVEWITSAGESAFVRIEMRHPGRQMAALSNPVFLS